MPFTHAEHLRLMQNQPAGPYCAVCARPGRGDTSAHVIREPGNGEPDWATVTRLWAVCDREWARA